LKILNQARYQLGAKILRNPPVDVLLQAKVVPVTKTVITMRWLTILGVLLNVDVILCQPLLRLSRQKKLETKAMKILRSCRTLRLSMAISRD